MLAGGMEGGRKGKCVCEREGAREDEHVLSESERDREMGSRSEMGVSQLSTRLASLFTIPVC